MSRAQKPACGCTVDSKTEHYDDVRRARRTPHKRVDKDLALVHQAVVQAAQGDEVRELGLPAVGPVLDVVRIDVALVGTAGEAPAAIAGMQKLLEIHMVQYAFFPYLPTG